MQMLTDQGWTMYYECMCGGSLKQYWVNPLYPSYELRIRPKKNTFSILCNNHIIFGPAWLYQLEPKLKEYGIYQG